ncbi:MAG: class A beta-lactamase-related serine hydrolase [Bacteroidota bacterium]|nr:class A beta-lactamase-related serine hydrolase [Bacteroidota bacterium]
MKNLSGLLFLFIFLNAGAQNTDQKLQKQIGDLVKGFHGITGIYVHDLKKDRIASFNADTVFPTASVVKIPIMIGIMNRIQNKELEFHQVMIYRDTINYDPGEDILASFRPGEKILLSKLMLLSISLSDNTASLMLQGIAGGGLRINQLMDSLGYLNTRVNSRTPGREKDREIFGWGQTTPKEIAGIMEHIVSGKIWGRRSSERMLRTLGREYWDENAISQIPPDVFVASKSGALDECRNEILYVNAVHPYIFSIFTKNNKDQSWDYNNEAWVLTRKLSALLFKYFNPEIKWEGEPVTR